MDTTKTILIVGGDLRQVHMASLLCKDNINNKIYAYGFDKKSDFDKNVIKINNLSQLDENVDVLILPIPAMADDNTINTSFSDKRIDINNVLNALNKNCFVLAGKINQSLKEKLQNKGFDYCDYLKREELAVMNTIPTVEGTIQIIMEELPVTIHGLNVFIIGSGRISKVLRRYLVSMGAKVTVVARKYSDLAWSEIDGSSAIFVKDLKQNISQAELIVNTVPAKILDEDILKNVAKTSLMIDLASKPGGIDFDEASRLGIKTIWALSLPGKTSPITAGRIIFNTVKNIIDTQ